jgi:carbon-monoxide dehydrogenase iron sulfur subunit
MVCSFEHFNRFSPALARITVHKDDRNGLDYPVTCRQCTECPPINACPEQALSRKEGLTWCSWQDCTGCGVCEKACTYGAIKVKDKALVCDMCGGDPQCVARCPTAALEYIETPPSTETPHEAFSRLKEEWGFE